MLVTDADTAVTSKAFRAAMDGLGVETRLRAGRNDIATVDRAIGLLKETSQRFRAPSGKSDWGEFLQKAVKAFNANRLGYLMGEPPRTSRRARTSDSLFVART